jgi:RimJ/RimL family protein N-acetyltransferase
LLGHSSSKTTEIYTPISDQARKGLGQEIVHLLLDYVFTKLDRASVELNVFDWNIEAIKCYEKVGFEINPNKILERKVNDKIWNALNRTIEKANYTILNK